MPQLLTIVDDGTGDFDEPLTDAINNGLLVQFDDGEWKRPCVAGLEVLVKPEHRYDFVRYMNSFGVDVIEQ